MLTPATQTQSSPALINDNRDTAFDLCERISPIAIMYGIGGRLHVGEYNSSRRLLKELWRLGRDRVPIHGMMSQLGTLDRASIRALNCYLEHKFSETPRSVFVGRMHRWAWYDFQRDCALRWVR